MSETKVEYETIQIGSALLVRGILKELAVVNAIDSSINAQPEIAVTYGHLLQVIIVNRLTFNPQPLYRLGQWAAEHGIDHLFGIEAKWLDDDRLGAGLDAIADHSVEIWIKIIKRARQRFKLPFDELHGDTTSIYFEGQFPETKTVGAGGATATKSAPKAALAPTTTNKEAAPPTTTNKEAAPPTTTNKEAAPPNIPRLAIGYNKDGQRDKKQMVLSLLNVGRVPVWFRPWDGNKSDDGVCLNDLKAMREQMLLPENALLIGDSKVCQQETMLECCRNQQRFLAPHPWTPTAKAVWRETCVKLEAKQLAWQKLDYVSQNNARKPEEQRPQHQVCEVPQALEDKAFKTSHDLRWLFIHSSSLAETSLRQREKALAAGAQSLDRLAGLVGKYQYRERPFITRRIEEELRRAKASNYFHYTLTGTEGERDWRLTWERNEEAIKDASSFDGIMLLCTNAPAEALPATAALPKYKEQIGVEQTIDFIKSPVQIRPTWLHRPKRIVGLTLLIMIAVLLAMLLEFEVRRLLKEQNKQIKGLRPEGRKDPLPTAKSLLRAFVDYTLVIIKHADGRREIYYPKLKSVPQQIWDLLNLPPLPGSQPP
jgi:transposase